jgi:hypothetical protein
VSRKTRRACKPAGSAALTGDGLSLFDFIHGHGLQMGIGASPLVTFGYFSLVDIYLIVVGK